MPLDKIPSLAKALQVDPMHLFKLALQQYWPDLGGVIEKMFGQLATQNEEQILLKKWREHTDNMDPAPTPEIEAIIDEALAKLRIASAR